jgi:hypothetical protein
VETEGELLLQNKTYLELWDVNQRRLVAKVTWEAGQVHRSAVSKDGRYLAIAVTGSSYEDMQGRAFLLDLHTRKEYPLQTSWIGAIDSLAFTPDDKAVLGSETTGRVLRWDIVPN